MTEEQEVIEAGENTEGEAPVEPQEQTQEQPVVEKDWSDEDEQEARLFGWKSPDEWQGDKPDGYIDNPEEFLGRVQRSRIFKTMNEKLEQTTSSAQEHARKLEAMSEKALEIQKTQFEARMADIVKRQRSAVEDGDTQAYDAAERDRTELLKNVPSEPEPGKQDDIDPKVRSELETFRANNKWAQNPILWEQAARAVNFMPGLQGSTVAEQLAYAENVIKEAHPHLFKAATPPRQKVEGGGLATGGKKSAYDKLPDTARSQFKQFVEQGIYKDTKEDKEEYANEYTNS